MAETLSTPKNTSLTGLVEAGIVASSRGKVRLLKPEELPANWDPTTDPRLTAWETVHHLIRVLQAGGEAAAASLVAKLGAKAETARELCYRLYTLCERKKRAPEALAYNGLVLSWPEITRLAREGSKRPSEPSNFRSPTRRNDSSPDSAPAVTTEHDCWNAAVRRSRDHEEPPEGGTPTGTRCRLFGWN